MSSHQRFVHIDVIKGVAIFLVVLGHVYYFAADRHTDTIWFFLVSSWHMPAFMMLAGYFSAKPLDLRPRGVWKYWRGKMERLLLPLLFIPLLFNWVQHGFSVALPLNMYLFNYWFTYVLFLIFGLFYLHRLGEGWLARLLKLEANPKRWLLDICISFLVIWLIHQLRFYVEVHHPGLYKPTHAQNIDWLYKYFLLGYWMKCYPKLEEMMKNELVGMFAFFVLVLSAYAAFALGMDWADGIILTLSGLFFSYFAVYQFVSGGGAQTQSLHVFSPIWVKSR
ncbi:MAG: acyltransferase family protein [Porphyromonadaceae bacterium]|nr:acyltransferase family protein [Porphyromonadaceae bacterium]